jgi:hypothetical protein
MDHCCSTVIDFSAAMLPINFRPLSCCLFHGLERVVSTFYCYLHGSNIMLRNVVRAHICTLYHSTDVHNINFHLRENLRSCNEFVVWQSKDVFRLYINYDHCVFLHLELQSLDGTQYFINWNVWKCCQLSDLLNVKYYKVKRVNAAWISWLEHLTRSIYIHFIYFQEYVNEIWVLYPTAKSNCFWFLGQIPWMHKTAKSGFIFIVKKSQGWKCYCAYFVFTSQWCRWHYYSLISWYTDCNIELCVRIKYTL